MILLRFINIKTFILIFLCIVSIKAQASVDLLNSTFNKVYANLVFYKVSSYNLKITTLESNNISSTYTADVTEVYNNDSHYAIYKLNNNHIFFSYSNILGIQRFWLGKIDDLPEIYSKDIDNKFLNTAISYSNLNINPLWYNIPIKNKDDQGFLVIQTYSKNLFTNFPKIEFYINKENIPIRTLYYNKISNFPVLEVLITDYKKNDKGFIVYKTEYKDNSTKRVTTVEKTNVKFDTAMPVWFGNIENLINSNTSNYYTSFMIGIRTKDDIKDLKEETSNIKDIDSTKKIPDNDLGAKNNSLIPKEDSQDLSPQFLFNTPLPNGKNKNANKSLLEELEALNNDSVIGNVPDKSAKNTIEKDKSLLDSKQQNKKVPNNPLNNSIGNKSKPSKSYEKKQNDIVNRDNNLKNSSKKASSNKKTNLDAKNSNNISNKQKDKYVPKMENHNQNKENSKNNTLKSDNPNIKNKSENKENLHNDKEAIPLKKEKNNNNNIINNLF